MNRAERRRLKSAEESSQKKRMVREEDIENIVTKAREDAVVQMWTMMMGFPLLVLRDHYGFGRKRLTDFMAYLVTTYNDFQEGYFSLNDLIDVICEEGGIDVTKVPEGLKVMTRSQKNKTGVKQ